MCGHAAVLEWYTDALIAMLLLHVTMCMLARYMLTYMHLCSTVEDSEELEWYHDLPCAGSVTFSKSCLQAASQFSGMFFIEHCLPRKSHSVNIY